MPGVQLVACSLALSASGECVYPVLSLCERGPLFISLRCQLGTKSQGETMPALKHTHTHTCPCAHAPPSVLPPPHTSLSLSLPVDPMERIKRGQTRGQGNTKRAVVTCVELSEGEHKDGWMCASGPGTRRLISMYFATSRLGLQRSTDIVDKKQY